MRVHPTSFLGYTGSIKSDANLLADYGCLDDDENKISGVRMMTKKKVLLTGASGSMGGEAFNELIRRKDKYDIVLFLKPSRKNKKGFSRYENLDGISIKWGDLCNFRVHAARRIPECQLLQTNAHGPPVSNPLVVTTGQGTSNTKSGNSDSSLWAMLFVGALVRQ